MLLIKTESRRVDVQPQGTRNVDLPAKISSLKVASGQLFAAVCDGSCSMHVFRCMGQPEQDKQSEGSTREITTLHGIDERRRGRWRKKK